jgi:hypothetical protein
MKDVRQIKFRFWDAVRKVMDNEVTMIALHWKCDKDPAVYCKITEGFVYDEYGRTVPYYSDGALMQFTGLTDRNGKEIYEGDVFPPTERTRGEVTIVCYDSKQGRYKAVPLSLYKANAGNGGWTGYDLNQFSEVIGNIYEMQDGPKGSETTE